ncbi:hypothetical protein [uncultured Devosia sp.]|uniref:hypothetical protein n=1 Tax=uncultured Devosia sp. TaxID=211434 RepID=UPI0035CA8243
MVTHHFIVARSDSHWKVSFHGTEQSPFESKEEALVAAVAAARVEFSKGLEVEVLVQDIDSTFHSAWKSGADGENADLSTSQ